MADLLADSVEDLGGLTGGFCGGYSFFGAVDFAADSLRRILLMEFTTLASQKITIAEKSLRFHKVQIASFAAEIAPELRFPPFQKIRRPVHGTLL